MPAQSGWGAKPLERATVDLSATLAFVVAMIAYRLWQEW
jgi:hypothetical protein